MKTKRFVKLEKIMKKYFNKKRNNSNLRMLNHKVNKKMGAAIRMRIWAKLLVSRTQKNQRDLIHSRHLKKPMLKQRLMMKVKMSMIKDYSNLRAYSPRIIKRKVKLTLSILKIKNKIKIVWRRVKLTKYSTWLRI